MTPASGPSILGVGETGYRRGPARPVDLLLLEAAALAMRDAGAASDGVDGVIVCGMPPGSIDNLVAGLGLRDVRFSASVELGGASAAAAVGLAATALRDGAAERVVISFGWNGFSEVRLGAGGTEMARKLAEWLPNSGIRRNLEHPYGLVMPMQYYALHANRWIHEYGIDAQAREAMALIALTCRSHAQGNASACMRGRPLSRADYDASPMLSAPLKALDCCIETDGASAIVMGDASDARGDAPRPVRVRAAAEGRADSPDDIVGRTDMLQLGLSKAAPRAFAAAGVGPADIDFAQIYDCFTFIVLRQLEELGFCARGEAPGFIAEAGIGIDGDLPLNTHGGLLSQGHSIGMGHVIEAVRQLRGDAGANQLDRPRLGLVSGYGDLGDGSVAILEAA